MQFRIGFGYDVHKLENDLPFFLGGIQLAHYKGALGHSDADVLLHAICDALLGAANLRDIGYNYPDSNPEFKGIDSKFLLKDTYNKIKEKGFRIQNIDSTVCLQKPKISEYISLMKTCIAGILEITSDDVSIKATTTEKLGFVGREEGVSAYTVVLLIKEGNENLL